MDPMNPVKPSYPSAPIRRPEGKVRRREPGSGENLKKQDNLARKKRKPVSSDNQDDSKDHQVDELA